MVRFTMPYKHEVAADLIRADLGEPGSEVPSETEWMQRLDMGRNTVRRALNELEREGRITSSQGQRRRVRDVRRFIYDLNRFERSHRPGADAWSATVIDQGATAAATSVRSEMVTADEMVSARLNIEVGDYIASRYRVHLINDYPHQLSRSFYPRWVTDENEHLFLPDHDVKVTGGLMAASGHRQVRFHDYIATRLPVEEEAIELRMPPTMPLLVHLRTGYQADGRPVRVQEDLWPSDQAGLTVDVPNE